MGNDGEEWLRLFFLTGIKKEFYISILLLVGETLLSQQTSSENRFCRNKFPF